MKKQQAGGPVRCGIVLAGGDGRRLRSFITRLRGEALPKQYVNLIGRRSMLEHTFDRVQRLIPAERVFTIASRDHLDYPEAERQLANRPMGTVIMQPENKETGPGLFLPLMHLHARHPDAVVVVFPSDHFIAEEALFMGHVDLACRVVERDPSRVVILGVEPDGMEADYGYIVPGHDVGMPTGLRRVARFVEKPAPVAIKDLVRRGGLWNTMVMAFRTATLLTMARRIAPAFSEMFRRIGDAVGTPRERAVVEQAYTDMAPMNFSRDLLEALPRQPRSPLTVLPVRGVFWSDWGSEERIASVLRHTGYAERLNRAVVSPSPTETAPICAGAA
jgi:mannose-1-phosphate guanylyltransferase